jgi:hypothetical protein
MDFFHLMISINNTTADEKYRLDQEVACNNYQAD